MCEKRRPGRVPQSPARTMPRADIRTLAAVLLLLAMPAPRQSFAADLPHLRAHPASTAAGPVLPPPGYVQVGGAIAYVPPGLAAARPAPLLLLLHGAGGAGADMITAFRAEADRCGVILLAPTARASTWDIIVAEQQQQNDATRIAAGFGTDVRRIDTALAAAFDRFPIDPKWIGVAGFSDGASYALALGLANPDLFRAALAFSPGLALGGGGRADQRIFVSHGTKDRVLSFDFTRKMVSNLRRGHAQVMFRSFDGDHEMPRAVRAEAINYFLDAAEAGDRVSAPCGQERRVAPADSPAR